MKTIYLCQTNSHCWNVAIEAHQSGRARQSRPNRQPRPITPKRYKMLQNATKCDRTNCDGARPKRPAADAFGRRAGPVHADRKSEMVKGCQNLPTPFTTPVTAVTGAAQMSAKTCQCRFERPDEAPRRSKRGPALWSHPTCPNCQSRRKCDSAPSATADHKSEIVKTCQNLPLKLRDGLR